MSNSNQIQKWVAQFLDEVIQQTECLRQGDPRTGNKHAKRYIAAWKRLCEIGDQGRDALVPLLTHSRADVRATAAAFLLRHKTECAIQVLQSEASGSGLTAFEAGQTLKRWQEGTWNLDP